MEASRTLTRRRILLGAAGLGLLAMPALAPTVLRRLRRVPVFLSASDDLRGGHRITAFDLRTGTRFSLPVEQRCHEAVFDPRSADRALVVARRPGTQLYEIDLVAGRCDRTVSSPTGRHVYGHAEFSPDGALLYVTENDFEQGRGVIAVYDGRRLKRLGELPSHGVGPHEIRLLSDGTTLVVANGGIRTHPSHGREKLNLDTMDPSLVYVDSRSGALLGQHRLADRRAGLRHLDVSAGGLVAVAIQCEGDAKYAHPLLAFHSAGGELRLVDRAAEVLPQLEGYAASVCFDATGRRAALTCPHGDRVAFFDVASGRLAGLLTIRDPGGITLSDDGDHFLVTTGFGEIHRIDAGTLRPTPGSPAAFDDLRWDNHLTRC